MPSLLAPVDYAVGHSPSAVATADLRNNGIQDLVVCNSADNTVSVLLGNGDGTFQPTRAFATGTDPVSVAVGDFNGDGKLDIVTANYGTSSSAGTVSVLLGNGDGTFAAPANFTLPAEMPPGYYGSTPLPQHPLAVAVGDMNRDGTLDLVVTGQTCYWANNLYAYGQSDYANVLLGHGDGTFAVAGTTLFDGWNTGVPVNTEWMPSLALGDFNGDGNPDVAALGAISPSLSSNSVFLLPGNGDGTLGAPTSVPTGAAPVSLAAGDLNGDGKLDLVSADDGNGGVSVLLGNGDSTFQPAANVPLATWSPPGYTGMGTLPLGQEATGVVVGDLTGDGKLDLAVTAVSGYSVYAGTATDQYGTYKVYDTVIKRTVNVLLGQGDGHFTDTDVVPLNGSTTYGVNDGSPTPQGAATGDFNGDGHADVAVAEFGADKASVLLSGGDWLYAGGFPSSTTAGVAGNFTVQVDNGFGQPDTGYTGTVQFSSSDPLAMIVNPATGNLVKLQGFTYTFTTSDQGGHNFSVTLDRAGTQSITATDTTSNLTDAQQGITVNPTAASKMIVYGFHSPAKAGVAGSFTVAIEDAYGNVANSYAGTVHFTSSDAKASLPANYTFTAGQLATHTFSATLKTAGAQSITATDTVTASLTGTDGNITVNPAAASKFILTAPASINAGASFSLTLKMEDAYGNVVTNYPGTVHFSSTDRKVTLPANYTFTTADKGVHTFSGLVLRTKGNQKITITDTHISSLTVSVIVDVL